MRQAGHARGRMAARKTTKLRTTSSMTDSVTACKHHSKRINIPPAALEADGYPLEAPRIRYEYNPHLPPVLRFGLSETDRLPELLQIARQRPLTVEEATLPMFLIRPDVAMCDVLKTQPDSQIFTRFSALRVKPPQRLPDGQYVVSNSLYPTDKERIAAWFLDSDDDNRTFCICQAFFPDKTKWQKLAEALGEQGVIDEDRFEVLCGLRSCRSPGPPGSRGASPGTSR